MKKKLLDYKRSCQKVAEQLVERPKCAYISNEDPECCLRIFFFIDFRKLEPVIYKQVLQCLGVGGGGTNWHILLAL